MYVPQVAGAIGSAVATTWTLRVGLKKCPSLVATGRLTIDN